MERRFAGGEFISTVVKINPERVVPAAIRNEETPISSTRGNLMGNGRLVQKGGGWYRSVLTPATRLEPHPLPYELSPDGATVFSGLCAAT
jgi:hypothetical protein